MKRTVSFRVEDKDRAAVVDLVQKYLRKLNYKLYEKRKTTIGKLK